MTIRFLFANPLVWYKKAGNFLLQIGEQVPFGHFAIELETYGEPKVYESLFPKSQKVNRSEWNKHYTIVKSYEWEVPEHLRFQVLEWLEKQVGVRYAIEQIIFIGLKICLKAFFYYWRCATQLVYLYISIVFHLIFLFTC